MTQQSHPGLGSGALREGQRIRIEGTVVRKAAVTGLWLIKFDNDQGECLFDAAALSLSSPIEPAQCCCNASWLDLDQRDCPIHGAHPTPQASSEIREPERLRKALAKRQIIYTWPDPQKSGIPDQVVFSVEEWKAVEDALAPSRQGAAKRVEG